MTTLTRASNEWATRPADERYTTLFSLHAAATAKRNASVTKPVRIVDLSASVHDNEVVLTGTRSQAHMTNWAFGQLSKLADAPPSYLRTLPAPMAAECLNIGLKKASVEDTAKLLIQTDENEELTLRALNGDGYSRIYDEDISKRLLELEARGPWQPAPAAFDGSRGLYMGDRDMFCFMVDSDRRIFERLPGGGLSRGFFVWNSEVGSASFGVCSFLYAFICGNHLVWEAQGIKEVRLRHVGKANEEAFRTLAVELREYAEGSATEDEMKIQSARDFIVGKDKDAILDRIFGLRIPNLSRSLIGKAYDTAEKHVDWYGNPRSAWGMTNGLTEIARDLPNADEKVTVERAAKRVAEMAF